MARGGRRVRDFYERCRWTLLTGMTPMNAPQITPAELAALAAFDTPTICNALEVVLPDSPAGGYTTRPAICGFPALKPMVGYARTARMRAKGPPTLSASEVRELRHD